MGGVCSPLLMRLGRKRCLVRTDLKIGAPKPVGRLQIAMHDALLVRGFQRAGDLLGDRHCVIDREGQRPVDRLAEAGGRRDLIVFVRPS